MHFSKQLRRRAFVSALALVFLGGCAWLPYNPNSLVPSKRRAALHKSTEAFAANLRFSRFDTAAAFVKEGQRIEFLKLVNDPRSEIRFTDYEVQQVELGETFSEGRALVNFRLHRLPSLTEVGLQDEQVWEYDSWKNAWFLVPDLETYRNAGKPHARR